MTETTIAASEHIVSDSLKDVDLYLEFYGLANSYEEPKRPGLDDVAGVVATVKAALDAPVGQNNWESTSLPSGTSWAGQSVYGGRTFRLAISPGTLRVRSTDLEAKGRTEERAGAAGSRNIDMDLAFMVDLETGEISDEVPNLDGPSSAEITSWSRKSRANMSETLASLDYSGWSVDDGALAMVTFTLPGDWKPLAPDGKSFKRLIEIFRRRFVRAVGPWRLLWKLEFQKRGAPHYHALMRVPALVGGVPFEAWLSKTWADVVGASKEVDSIDEHGKESSEYTRHLSAGTGVDFSGKDFSDPRRIALYFSGHSAKSQDGKEYQHKVPAKWQRPGAGPGRFWGYCGLEKAVIELDVTQRDFDRLRREMRKMARARSWEIACKRLGGAFGRLGMDKGHLDAFFVRAPKLRRSMYGGGGGQNGGWVLLNDALKVAGQLSTVLSEPPRRHRSPDVVAQHWLWDQMFERFAR